MISDVEDLPDGSTIESDVCIIGAGAAGIAIGRELAGSGLDVCILESGGLELEAETQALSQGDAAGVPYFGLAETRYRILGGSTLRWGARGAPFQEIDFQQRSWVSGSGWPIALDSLAPYYRRAESLIGMDTDLFYDGRIWDHFGGPPLKLELGELRFCAFQFGKTLLFGHDYRSDLQAASNVHVYLHANATALCATPAADRVESVEVRTLTGRRYSVRAKRFVLAAGGIENPRLLLASNQTTPQGLCNEHDLVGRFFMEHPTASVGIVKSDRADDVLQVFSPGSIRGRLVETGLSLEPDFQCANECLNAVASVRPNLGKDGTEALRRISWDLKHRRRPAQLAHRLGTAISDPIGVTRNIVGHLQGKPIRQNVQSLRLEVRAEQEPNAESRVILSDAVDALGARRARLEWRLTERDRATFRVTAKAAANELRALRLGSLVTAGWVESADQRWPDDLVGGHHHMGTTRMSSDSTSGVVDEYCRAHSAENLFIAGSSVFPTTGFVNPTPTLIALAIRLADHLKG
jgi:choline dehydrogenase-like flavoprotein